MSTPRERAAALLQHLLDDQQRDQLARLGAFVVTGSNDHDYVLAPVLPQIVFDPARGVGRGWEIHDETLRDDYVIAVLLSVQTEADRLERDACTYGHRGGGVDSWPGVASYWVKVDTAYSERHPEHRFPRPVPAESAKTPTSPGVYVTPVLTSITQDEVGLRATFTVPVPAPPPEVTAQAEEATRVQRIERLRRALGFRPRGPIG